MIRPVAFAFALLVSTTLVEAQTTAAPKAAGSPEEAVTNMIKAAKAGDVDATLNSVVEEQAKPLKEWYKAQETLASSINKLVETLDSTFGKDPTSQIKKVTFDLKSELSHGFVGYSIVGKPTVIDDETVNLNVKVTMTGPDQKPIEREQVIKARKTVKGWKLVFEDLGRADFPQSVKFMDSMRASLDRTSKGVKDGSIKDRAGAMKEIEMDRPASLPGNVPLPRFLTQPG